MTDDGLVGQPRYRARSEVLRRWWCGLWREVVLSEPGGPADPCGLVLVVAGTAYWLIGFVEDLRDVPGDTTVGRRTLPVVLGAPVVRGAVGVALVLVPCATLWALEPNITAPVLIWLSVLALGCVLVTVRLWVLRSPRQDALTYQLYCCVWCWLLCGPAFSV